MSSPRGSPEPKPREEPKEQEKDAGEEKVAEAEPEKIKVHVQEGEEELKLPDKVEGTPEEPKKEQDKGYFCSVCGENFLSCNRILAHMRKTGHGSVRCLSCLEYLPSLAAKKKHAKKTGHNIFSGTITPARECRGGPTLMRQQSDYSHFLDIRNPRRHESEFVTVVPEPELLIFSPAAVLDSELREEKINPVRQNIPEPVRPEHQFVPLNPFEAYNPNNPFWVPTQEPPPEEPEPEEDEGEEEEEEQTPAETTATTKKPVAKPTDSALSKRAKRNLKKKLEGATYTPFGKATVDSEARPFDLQFALTYEAQAEHNLQLAELIIEDQVEQFPPPADWLLGRMEKEWSGEATVEHWEYVHEAVPESPEDRELVEGDGRDLGNENLTIEGFMKKEMAINASLNRAEVVALRLYTGPGFKAINASTRKGDNAFCVSCFALESAIIKVAKQTKKANVVRGLSGKMSDRFQQMYNDNTPLKPGDVIADPGFLSTTRNLEVATSGNYKGNTLFLITGRSQRPGLLRMGADVSWISQFPAEQEVLFPQYTELWYALKEKRCPHMTQKFGHLKKTQVFQFGARAKFNEEHNCPHIPGITQS